MATTNAPSMPQFMQHIMALQAQAQQRATAWPPLQPTHHPYVAAHSSFPPPPDVIPPSSFVGTPPRTPTTRSPPSPLLPAPLSQSMLQSTSQTQATPLQQVAPATYAQRAERRRIHVDRRPRNRLRFEDVCTRCGDSSHARRQCMYFRTKACNNAANCTYGDACHFAHGAAQLRNPQQLRCIKVVELSNGEAAFLGCGGDHLFSDCTTRLCQCCGRPQVDRDQVAHTCTAQLTAQLQTAADQTSDKASATGSMTDSSDSDDTCAQQE